MAATVPWIIPLRRNASQSEAPGSSGLNAGAAALTRARSATEPNATSQPAHKDCPEGLVLPCIGAVQSPVHRDNIGEGSVDERTVDQAQTQAQ